MEMTVAGSFYCLLKLVPQCYAISFFIQYSAPEHWAPAVVELLWSFCWLVSSISIKGVRGLGKRISKPCNWHNPSPLHPFSHMWQKTCFFLCPSWLNNASLLLRWECLRGQNATLFFQRHLKWHRKKISSESFWRAVCKTWPHFVKVHPDEQCDCLASWEALHTTLSTNISCHFIKKMEYCSFQVLHNQLIFSENPPFCIHLTDYVNYKGTVYSYGEETSVFNYSAWLTVRHKQCKAFQQRLNHELWMNWRVLSGSRVCFGR